MKTARVRSTRRKQTASSMGIRSGSDEISLTQSRDQVNPMNHLNFDLNAYRKHNQVKKKPKQLLTFHPFPLSFALKENGQRVVRIANVVFSA